MIDDQQHLPQAETSDAEINVFPMKPRNRWCCYYLLLRLPKFIFKRNILQFAFQNVEGRLIGYIYGIALLTTNLKL